MIRTGQEYRESIRDGREVCINRGKVEDVTTHPMFKSLVDIRARIHDMVHEAALQPAMACEEDGECHAASGADDRQ
jgi:4-hydroxyphenylacetate 3-monooxygenase